MVIKELIAKRSNKSICKIQNDNILRTEAGKMKNVLERLCIAIPRPSRAFFIPGRGAYNYKHKTVNFLRFFFQILHAKFFRKITL